MSHPLICAVCGPTDDTLDEPSGPETRCWEHNDNPGPPPACATCSRALTVWEWLGHDSGPALCFACAGRELAAKQAAEAVAAAADAVADAEARGYARGVAAERAATVAHLRLTAEEGGDPWMAYVAADLERGAHRAEGQPEVANA